MKLDIESYSMIDNHKIKLRGPFVNRELSWIDFNRRVMGCALKKNVPMNERLNFLGITESNLDEFIFKMKHSIHYRKKLKNRLITNLSNLTNYLRKKKRN